MTKNALKELLLFIKSKLDEKFDKTTASKIVDNGVKNLVYTDLVKRRTEYPVGIILENNGDGTLTISGENSSSTNQIILTNINTASTSLSTGYISGQYISKTGVYVVSTGEDNPNIRLDVCYSNDGTNTTLLHYTTGMNELNFQFLHKYVWFRLTILANAKFDTPVIIKPMICRKELYDISQEFVPYAVSNNVLTSALIDVVNDGRKNLFKPTLTIKTTTNGITCTPNENGTFTISGTANETATFVLSSLLTIPSEKMQIVLSGCPAGGDYQNGYALYVYKKSDKSTIAYDTGTGIRLQIPDSECGVAIIVRKGMTVSNLVFKPMICKKSLYDASSEYVPYVSDYTKVEAVDNPIILNEGYTLLNTGSRVYKQGEHIFGNLVIKCDNPIIKNNDSTTIGMLRYPPTVQYNCGGFCGFSEYRVTGFINCIINSGSGVSVRHDFGEGDCIFLKIPLNYRCSSEPISIESLNEVQLEEKVILI